MSEYDDPVLDNALHQVMQLLRSGDQAAKLAMRLLDQAGYTQLTLNKVCETLGLPHMGYVS